MRTSITFRNGRKFAATLLLGAALAGFGMASNTVHLNRAMLLVNNMRLQGEKGLFTAPNGKPLNQYGAAWPNAMVSIGSPARTYARCSSFVTLMMMISYPGWTAQNAGFGSASPTAAMYHDAFEASSNGFKKVPKFSLAHPGDLLAVKYSDPDDDTGHIMILVDAVAGAPDANGVTPWTVDVIDCSKSGHSQDTRNFSLGGGTTIETNGAGSGKMLVFTKNDKIVGYAWSLLNGSTIYTPDVRHMTIGRYMP